MATHRATNPVASSILALMLSLTVAAKQKRPAIATQGVIEFLQLPLPLRRGRA